ncbi:MAG: methyltransferase domain-containing protein [Saprospiraceae bacterium]|nr:methyltransferase domain-containing protein [Saprospiraceae bacterium]
MQKSKNPPATAPITAPIVEYYNETGLDYGSWSKEFNMHFGYWRWPFNPLRRERMLEEMNLQVIQRLQLTEADQSIFDLGCGLAAPARSLARVHPGKRITGVTIVPWQVQKAEALNRAAGLDEQISLLQANYLQIPLPAGAADAAYALESCCHSPGLDKALFVEELHRILRPGGRFVLVDGCTKTPARQWNPVFRRCMNTVCAGWALPAFPDLAGLKRQLETAGFEDIQAEDISWQVAPSALHSPWCVARFIFQKWREGEKLNRVRWGHLKACLLGLVLGMHRQHFGYYMISGKKGA